MKVTFCLHFGEVDYPVCHETAEFFFFINDGLQLLKAAVSEYPYCMLASSCAQHLEDNAERRLLRVLDI